MTKLRSSDFSDRRNGISQTAPPAAAIVLGSLLDSGKQKGISALELQRKLGLKSYQTAWLLLHKLRKAMASSGQFPLRTMVEADETYIGGAKEGKAGSFLTADYQHDNIILKEHKKKRELLSKVYIVIANLKMWLRGTFNRYPEKHIHSYLNEFAFRFNRRWKMENIFNKLLNRCLITTTITFAELTG